MIERIQPSLQQGQHVVSDRFSLSTWAYQGAGRGLGDRAVEAAIDLATDGLRPHITFLLDIDPEAAALRRAGRGDDEDRLEQEGLAFQRRIRDGYLQRALHEGDTVVIDAAPAAESVHEVVYSTLIDRFSDFPSASVD